MRTPEQKRQDYQFYIETLSAQAQTLATVALTYATLGFKEDAAGLANAARENALQALGKAHDIHFTAGEVNP